VTKELKNRNVLITGGSSGIGRSLVSRLAHEGYRVITCARQIDRLEELKRKLLDEDFEIFTITTDLRDEDSILKMFAEIREGFGGIEVLINCAGIGHNAPLLSSPSEPWRETIDVNIIALCICTREAVRIMHERGDRGHIVNICSMLGHRVGKFPGMYTATKFAVRALTESVRMELAAKGSNIRVSQVSPGRVETEFHEKYFKAKDKAQAMYSEYKSLEGDDVANAVLYILSQPEHVAVDDILVKASGQQ
jgi:NADP-dependent 3-hydroxy acid dehydrogenase YdfG